jgi:hypothetical protein
MRLGMKEKNIVKVQLQMQHISTGKSTQQSRSDKKSRSDKINADVDAV